MRKEIKEIEFEIEHLNSPNSWKTNLILIIGGIFCVAGTACNIYMIFRLCFDYLL